MNEQSCGFKKPCVAHRICEGKRYSPQQRQKSVAPASVAERPEAYCTFRCRGEKHSTPHLSSMKQDGDHRSHTFCAPPPLERPLSASDPRYSGTRHGAHAQTCSRSRIPSSRWSQQIKPMVDRGRCSTAHCLCPHRLLCAAWWWASQDFAVEISAATIC